MQNHALAFVLLALVPLAAAADNGLQLAEVNVQGQTAAGSCGAAKVSVQGLTQTDASGHANIIVPNGSIAVHVGSKTIRLGQAEPFFLQDRSVLACVNTPLGKRLVVATFCDGRSCEPVEYLIVDPAQGKVLAPSGSSSCTLSCAERQLGGSPPLPLREPH